MNKFIDNLSKEFDILIPYSNKSSKGYNSYSLNQDGNVKELFLNGVKLKNLDTFLPIADKLEILSLEDCSIEHINSPSAFTFLKKLNLSDNPIDQSALKSLIQIQNLTELNLSMTEIVDTHILNALTKLTKLDLSFNVNLTEVRGFKENESLKHLILQFSKIDSLEKIEVNENIQSMNINSGRLSLISGLGRYTNLRNLDLSGGKIRKIEGLNHLIKLKRLSLSANQIDKIEGVSELLNLKTLDLSMNKINKIEGLECLINLEELSLMDNQISSIENLNNLHNLNCLLLDQNKINQFDTTFMSKLNSPCYISVEPEVRDLLSHNISDNVTFEPETNIKGPRFL